MWSMLVLRCPRISYGVIFGSCSCKARSWWLVLGVAGVLDIRGDNCRSIIGATHVFHIVNTCISVSLTIFTLFSLFCLAVFIVGYSTFRCLSYSSGNCSLTPYFVSLSIVGAFCFTISFFCFIVMELCNYWSWVCVPSITTKSMHSFKFNVIEYSHFVSQMMSQCFFTVFGLALV